MKFTKSQPVVTEEERKFLAPFIIFGVQFYDRIGDQEIGDCPFCSKEKHFYVNARNGKWDCKGGNCGKSGGIASFLTEIYDLERVHSTQKDLESLSQKRNIPIRILNHFGVIHLAEKEFIVPIYKDDYIHDLKRYNLAHKKPKLIPVTTRSLQIFNLKDLLDKDKFNETVYICEGEWDAMALYWLFDKTGNRCTVIGIPGAQTFKGDWVNYFVDRNIVVCFDNDSAGDKGHNKVRFNLQNVCKSIKHINWPHELKAGYDMSDLVYDQAIQKRSFQNAINKIAELTKMQPRDSETTATATTDTIKLDEVPQHLIPTLPELFQHYRNALDINEELEDVIRVILATTISVDHEDDSPLWQFIVGPPGCGKTTLLMSLVKSQRCVYQSNLSAQALISGYQKPGQPDPSLMPKLHGRTLICKDWTETLNKNEQGRLELLAVLRGAFDGTAERIYGSGTSRHYKSRFTFLAGCTKSIFAYLDPSMGERFLKFIIDTRDLDVDKLQDSVLDNSVWGSPKMDLLKDKVSYFLASKWDFSPERLQALLPDWFRPRLKRLAAFAAKARTSVVRFASYDRNAGQPVYLPEEEYSSRLIKQLQRLAFALAIIENKPQIDEKIYSICKRVAIDTVFGYQYILTRELIKSEKDAMTVDDLSKKLPLSKDLIGNCLDDMFLIGIAEKKPRPGGVAYKINPQMKLLWSEACL